VLISTYFQLVFSALWRLLSNCNFFILLNLLLFRVKSSIHLPFFVTTKKMDLSPLLYFFPWQQYGPILNKKKISLVTHIFFIPLYGCFCPCTVSWFIRTEI
jgi:hypothetical protein